MHDKELYTVKVNGPGLTLERSVMKEVSDQVVILLLTGSLPKFASGAVARAGTSEDGGNSAHGSHATVTGQSIRQFVDEVGAKRLLDKITTFGAFLRDSRGLESFGRNDLVACFEEAAESVPKNLSRDIQWTLKTGWIAPRAGQKDAYYVTNLGNRAVEQKFSAEMVRPTRNVGSTARRSG